MPLTKEDLLRTGVANQAALVQRLQDQPIKPIRHQIPGGKSLMEQVDKETLVTAIYNWLRRVRSFKQVIISFASELDDWDANVQKVWELEVTPIPGTNILRPEWETNEKGKKYLAERLRDAIWEGPCLGVKATLDGIYVYTDKEDKFGPTRLIDEDDLKQQERIIKEIFEETKAKAAELEIEWKEPKINRKKLGETTPAEVWNPYIEFIPTRKNEYGR